MSLIEWFGFEPRLRVRNIVQPMRVFKLFFKQIVTIFYMIVSHPFNYTQEVKCKMSKQITFLEKLVSAEELKTICLVCIKRFKKKTKLNIRSDTIGSVEKLTSTCHFKFILSCS